MRPHPGDGVVPMLSAFSYRSPMNQQQVTAPSGANKATLALRRRGAGPIGRWRWRPAVRRQASPPVAHVAGSSTTTTSPHSNALACSPRGASASTASPTCRTRSSSPRARRRGRWPWTSRPLPPTPARWSTRPWPPAAPPWSRPGCPAARTGRQPPRDPGPARLRPLRAQPRHLELP